MLAGSSVKAVRRERIVRAIRESMDLGIAMIVAPAGSGKTEAVMQAVDDEAIIVTLDRHPDFNSVVLEFASRVFPRSRRAAAAFLQTVGDRPERVVEVTEWITRRLRDTALTIVIEDVHGVEESDAIRLIAAIASASVESTRWVLTSRSMPPWPVGTWIAYDWMRLPIDGSDLAFTFSEARELADSLGAMISDDDLLTVNSEAEGWPFVVRFALQEWNRSRAVVPLRIRTEAVLSEFIADQVWTGVGEADRSLLRAVALLGEGRPDLLAVGGFPEATERLTHLMGRIPIVRGSGGPFRLHALFADFVLERSNREETVEVGRRVIAAAVAAGYLEEGFAVCERIREWDLARDLLTKYGVELLERGSAAAVGRLLFAVPESGRGAYWNALRGLHFVALGANSAAEAVFKSLALVDVPAAIRARVYVAIAQLAINRGDLRVARTALAPLLDDEVSVQAEDRLDAVSLSAAVAASEGDFVASREASARALVLFEGVAAAVRARNLVYLAFASWYCSDYGKAESFGREAAEVAEAVGLPGVAARAYSVLQALSSMTQLDLAATSFYVDRWIATAKDAGDKSAVAMGLMGRILLCADLGDDEAYESTLAEFRLVSSVSPRHELAFRVARVVYDVGHGRVRAGISVLRGVDRDAVGEAGRVWRDAMLGVLLIVEGSIAEGDSLLRRPALTEEPGDFESRRALAYAAAYRSLGYWLLGNEVIATRSLGRASDELPDRDVLVLGVLRSLCLAPRKSLTVEKVGAMLAPLGAHEMRGFERFIAFLVRPASSAVSVLTRTELEVLGYFRNRQLTTRKVAHLIGRSPSTVSDHLESINRKLGCSTRAAAVDIAVANGWFD